MLADNYRNKRVLVTGHTGFKGGWLALWLKRLGAEVTGLALQPSGGPSFYEACDLGNQITSVIGDIRDRRVLADIFERVRPEIVFHLAAQSLVRYSYQEPVETYETNVQGTVHILEACRKSPSVKVIVNVTSDKCYENQERDQGYGEEDPMGGYDPYSSSKGCAELVTGAYLRSYFNPENFSRHNTCLASARAGNVVGGGDWAPDRLIPDCVRAFTKGQPVVIRYPNAIRPWQHVLEPLSGYLLLAQKMMGEGAPYSGAWNFGPDDSDMQTVGKVVDLFGRTWGREASWQLDQEENPHETSCLKLNCSKAKAILKWRPRWDLETALKQTVDWYQSFYADQDMLKISQQQIGVYEQQMNKEADELPILQ